MVKLFTTVQSVYVVFGLLHYRSCFVFGIFLCCCCLVFNQSKPEKDLFETKIDMVLDECDQKTLTEIRKKRGGVKASLTRILKFLEKFKPGIYAITLLDFRQEELPFINRKFDEI